MRAAGSGPPLKWVLGSELSIGRPRRFQNPAKGFVNLVAQLAGYARTFTRGKRAGRIRAMGNYTRA